MSIGFMFMVTCIEQIRLKHKGLAIVNSVLSFFFFSLALIRLFYAEL
ncbi:DUF3953 domain-containing protein [Bacillus sp. D386]